MIPDTYFGRFETAKYRRAGALKRKLIQRFARAIHDLFIEANPVQRVLEIGVGEGFLSGYLSEKFPEKQFTGVDLNPADIERLQRQFPSIEARVGTAYDLGDLPAGFDLVICAEVLEHLEAPDRALAEIQRLAPRRVILSVPHEPFFMLSNLLAGNNVRRLGNDSEHINHWNPTSFRRLIEPRFDVLRMTTSYPWVLCLAAPR
ncbi:class I SAM-dependent methyltransferase [Sorangium sp. So ce854]|uniref:class I SAM-dependent methyltransferase n=1 Tax=Sorangium sp. So ce854 TaxID=3133322 RepID=UPI003F647D05